MSFAFELYQKGHLTKKDTDGLELNWGDYHVRSSRSGKSPSERGSGSFWARG